MTPDEDGCYTIPADYDVTLHHDICIEDACGNKTYYNDIDILWNYLEVVREKDYWDVQPAQPIRISREQDLQEELSKVNILRIVESLSKGIVFGFVRVGRVVKDTLQAVLDRPNLSYRQ